MATPIRRRLTGVGGLAATCALAPATAQAHLVSTGMGPFYDGISHFAVSFEDLLPTIVLAAYAGLRGAGPTRAAVFVLPLTWLAGGGAAVLGASLPQSVLQAITATLFMLIGGLLAAEAKLGAAPLAGLAAVLGGARGLADMAGLAGGAARWGALAGMAVSAFIVFALAASVTLPLRRAWMVIAARVVGSWLAAIGLITAGWLLRIGTLPG